MSETGESTVAESEATKVVQAVVPVSVAAEIERDAKAEDTSDSRVIRRILKKHYGPRLKKASAKAKGGK